MEPKKTIFKQALHVIGPVAVFLCSLTPFFSQAGSCTPPPSGLVAWWAAEGNALDNQGINHGAFSNAMYAAGEVGQAFEFDGSGNNVRVPASPTLDVGAGSGMTIEAWIYSTDTSPRPIVEWVPKAVGAFGAHFYVHQGGVGVLYANLYDTAGNSHTIQTASGAVVNNSYQHVALTYDKATGTARLFVNGAVAAESVLGVFSPQTTPDLSIGYRPATVPFGPISFLGRIDEVSLYSRALAASEVQAIYAAGVAGKCFSQAPVIVTQPADQTVLTDASVMLAVLATGSQPLSFQWMMSGTNLPGATNGTLILNDVQIADSGNYAVQITNALGSVTSSNAVVTVTQRVCAPPSPGLVSWWPAEGAGFDLIGTNHGTTFKGAGFGPGHTGEGFTFNGTSSYVEIPDSASLSLTNAFTIEFWYKDTGVASGQLAGLVAKRPYSGPCNFGLSISGGNQGGFLAYFLDPNYGSYQGSTFSPLPAPGDWHHLAAIYRQTAPEQVEIDSFVDGQQVKSATFQGNLARTVNQDPVYFGCSNPTGGEFFRGSLDEISIYNQALSAADIAAIFNAGALGKCIPPLGPFVFAQPTNAAVLTGATVNLSVGAFGSQPLSYQWLFDGTNLLGATNAILTLTNVQLGDDGTYSVQITNSFGVATSSNVSLSVTPAPPCANPPAGLVSWWPGEGNANDNEGANNGVFVGPSFVPGKVGQSFGFDGSGNNVRIPASTSLDVGSGGGLTIEAWILSTDNSAGRPIVEWVPRNPGTFGTHLWVHAVSQGVLYANLYDTANASHIIQTAAGAVPLNQFVHVAVTYDKLSGIARLYVNGVQSAQSTLGTFTPQTSPDLCIGYRPDTVPFGPNSFIGQIDEVSLYSRSLSGAEISSIVAAGPAGKCNVPIAAGLFSQPANQTVTIGQTATFQVQAGGTWPLAYQWSKDGAALPGATNASLVLTNVQRNQAGVYAVQVTNLYGSVVSSNATLVVNFPPAPVEVVNTSGTAGQMVTVPVVLVANGNENAIGFSLNFPPTLLTNVGVTLGTGAAGGSLQFNSGMPGTVGIAVALPSGATFAPGTQEVAEVSFLSAVSAKPYTAQLTFGDQPTRRELSDPNVVALAANFSGGQVSLNRSAFEADVAPRPDGDGTVSIVDWVQIGRYVAALDSPTNASEFQRADCAPRSAAGDGLLTVSDWVQAGRYVTGLDPITLAAGPTGATGGGPPGPSRKRGTQTLRTVSVQGPLVFQGQTATAEIDLQAQGDENAVGLSLSFDPTAVAYTGALLGVDATSATMDVNDRQATNGQVGIILALPSDASFSAGTRQLVRVSFQAVTTNSVQSPVTLTDVPVFREVADTNALPVTASYTNGVISLNPRPSVGITQRTQTITLAWPTWATNYLLQSAVSNSVALTTWTNLPVAPVLTNNSFNVTVPVSGSVQFYRLQHQ